MTLSIEDLRTIILHQDERITALEILLTKRQRKKDDDKRPLLEHLPDAEAITKIRAEFFINEPKQGKVKYNLKLFIWTCQKHEMSQHQEGTIRPMFMWLYKASYADIEDPNSNMQVCHTLVRRDGEMDKDLIGCLGQCVQIEDKKGRRKHEHEAA